MSDQEPTVDHFLRDRDVTRVTGVSKSHRYVMIARGEFPKPIKISERSSAWSARDIAKWQQGRRDRTEA